MNYSALIFSLNELSIMIFDIIKLSFYDNFSHLSVKEIKSNGQPFDFFFPFLSPLQINKMMLISS
jgi:hypothetical protein